MKVVSPIQLIISLILFLFVASCGDSSDSAFPKPSCGSDNNACLEIVAYTISPANKTILVGYNQQYTATVFYDDGSSENVTDKSTWSLDDSTVANISNDIDSLGYATGIAAGTTLVSASYRSVTSSAQLNVIDEPVEQLIIVPVSTVLPVGTSKQFGAYLLLTNKQSIDVTEHVTWQMADTVIASIDQKAVVLALSQGNTELSASITHNDSALTATAEVTVIESSIKEILITPANGTFPVGTTGTYQASAHYTDGYVVDITKDASWTIADSNIASINQSGELAGFAKALAVGTTQVSASLQGVTGTTQATVTDAVIRSISINPVAAVVPAGVKVYYQAHALYSDDSVQNITRLAAWSSSVPEIGNIQFVNALAGVASTFSPGITQISAHFNGLTETVPLTVTAAVIEALQISPANPSVPLGTTGQFTAIAYYSDGASHDVSQYSSWQIDDDNVATIVPLGNDAGFTSSTAVGKTLVTATFSGQDASTELTVTNAVLTSLSLTPAQATVPAGAQQAYQLFGLYSDGSSLNLTDHASWQSSDSELATINAHGTASTLKQGEVDILATYQGTTKSAKLTITAAQLTGIDVSPNTLTVAVGHQVSFSAIAYYSDFTNHNISDVAVWSSEDTVIAKVSIGNNGGSTTGLSVGSTKIFASFNGQTANGSIEVTDAILESVSITPISASVAAGLKQQYTLTAVFSDSSKHDVSNIANWQSSDTRVATVDTMGLATSSVQGETTIQGSYLGLSANATLIVTQASLNNLQITPQNPIEPLGTTGQFTAIAYYSDNTTANVTQEVTWSSDDVDTVSVVTNGVNGGYASAEKIGETNITASFNSATASTKARVTEATLDSLSLTPASADIPSGSTQGYQLFALFSDGSSKEVTLEANWQSSDTNIANFETRGIATGISTGDVTVNASYNGVQATAFLIVTDATVEFITVSPATQNLPVEHSARLYAVAHYSDSTSKNINHLASWTVDDDTVASVNNSLINGGSVTGIAAGVATITATFSGQSASNITTVTGVTLESVTISPIDATIAAGLTQQYHLFALFSDSSSKDVTSESDWQSNDVNTVSINTLGLATSYYEGKVTITGTYQGLYASTSLTVTGAEITSLAISPIDPSVPVGTEDRFTATVHYTDGFISDISSSSTWSSSEPSIVSVVTSGVGAGYASAEQVGRSEISASYGGFNATTTATVTGAILESIVINNTEAKIAVGDTTSYIAIGFYSDGSYKNIPSDAIWSSSNTTVASIIKSGVSHGMATANAVGSANITVTSGSITSNTAILTVLAANQTIITSIQVTPANITVPLSTKDTYTAIAYYSNNTSINVTEKVSWISDDNAVVTIVTTGTQGGLASALAVGSANITASLDGVTSNIATVTVTGKVIDNIQITPNNKSYNLGQTEQYKVTVIYTDYSIKDVTAFSQITSKNPSIATFDVNNVMTTKGVGDAELSAVYQGVTSEREFLHVNAAVIESIQVTPATADVPTEAKGRFSAIGYYSDNTHADITEQATWLSDETDVVSIVTTGSNGGEANALAVGSANIFAKFGGVKSNESQINVIAPVLNSIEIVANNTEFPVGTNEKFRAKAHYSDGNSAYVTLEASWQSDNLTIATVVDGQVTGVNQGIATITATFSGETDSISVVITAAELSELVVYPSINEMKIGHSQKYYVTGIYNGVSQDVTNEVTWISSDISIASVSNEVSNKGLVTALTTGNTMISAYLNGVDSNLSDLEVSAAEISLENISIMPLNEQVTSQSSVYYTAKGEYSDGNNIDITNDVTWVSDDLSIATISPEGLAKTLAAGSTNIEASLDGKFASTQLTAIADCGSKAPKSIRLEPDPIFVKEGETIQLHLFGIWNNGCEMELAQDPRATWTSESTDVARFTDGESVEGGKGILRGMSSSKDGGKTQIKIIYKDIDNAEIYVDVTVTKK